MTRGDVLEAVQEQGCFDLVVIGGGITGAGILRRAAQAGLKALLLEQMDFSWGTSSRSGKLVHGGLRYIKQGQLGLTYHAVREREKLLKAYSRLVHPLRFAIPLEKGRPFTRLLFKVGLTLYDLFAGRKGSSFEGWEELKRQFPYLRDGLVGAYTFYDAETDDAKLTFQVILEAQARGALALNYARVTRILRDGRGRVRGVAFVDLHGGRSHEVRTKAVVSATGAWADSFDSTIPIRRLKGSHLVISASRLGVPFACALIHPRDNRPLYLLPWEGVTLLGTTDIDYPDNLDQEPRISTEEVEYLLEALGHWFPGVQVGPEDVLSTFSGVRGVMNTGEKDPSKETRDYILKVRDGLVSVTGGKLTTFDYVAGKVIRKVRGILGSRKVKDRARVLPWEGGSRESLEEFLCRFHTLLLEGNLEAAEVNMMARLGSVVHLHDLLLRRSRVGLLKKDGGLSLLHALKEPLKRELGWGEERWHEEVALYREVLKNYRLGEGCG